MRILVVRVIIRRGTLKTDTFIMLDRLGLSLCVIRGPSRRVPMVRGIRLSITRRWRRIVILRLTMGARGSERLTVGTVEHWLFTVAGILSILGPAIRLTGNRSACTGSIDSVGRNKGSL